MHPVVPENLQRDVVPEQQRRLQHVNRLYAVLSAVNRAITRRPERRELLQQICRILVEKGAFRMAWFGVPDAEGWVVPESSFGDSLGYLTSIKVSCRDIPEGRGPIGAVIRENRPIISNNILADPAMALWHIPAERNGFNSSACFPVLLPDGVIAGLTLYSTEYDFFSSEEESLLTGICADISFSLGFAVTQAALEALRESDQRFRIFGSVSQNAIIQLDEQGRVCYWNQAAELIFGYVAEEMIGRPLHQLLAPARYGESYRLAYEHFVRTGEGAAINRTVELSALRKNGEEFPMELSLAGFQPMGEWNSLGIVRDITERKRVEAALKEQTELLQQEVVVRRTAQELLMFQQQQLEELNLELESRVTEEVGKNRQKDQLLMQREKLASLGQLAAGVAHEINNPMGFIICNLSILSNYMDNILRFDRLVRERCADEPGPPVREGIAAARESLDIGHILEDSFNLISESLEGAERVTRIVEELKSFSRVDLPEYEPMALDSCLKSALAVCHKELTAVATIRTEIEPAPEILCYPGQLNQLFLNLLVNAGQAIPPPGPGEIVLKCWHDDLYLYASVSDSGSGIPEELRERIYEPFFTTRDVGEGSGLGLSIAAEIVKKHRGELLVESCVGQGSTFTVKLPRIPEETA